MRTIFCKLIIYSCIGLGLWVPVPTNSFGQENTVYVCLKAVGPLL